MVESGTGSTLSLAGEPSNCWPTTYSSWPYVWPITFTYNLSRCNWCQGTHSSKCPSLRAIEYHENGTVKRVEFFGA